MRVGWRHVHVEEQRRAEPDDDAGEKSRTGDPPRRGDREEDGDETVEGRAVGHRGDVGRRETVGGSARDPRQQIGGGVERAPQDARCRWWRSSAAVRPRSYCSRNVAWKPSPRPMFVREKVLILVLERHVVVEPERAQVGEILNLVGRVDPRRDGGQREHERGDEHQQLASRQRQRAGNGIEQMAYCSATNLTSCARLKPAWLTIGAMMLRRTR